MRRVLTFFALAISIFLHDASFAAADSNADVRKLSEEEAVALALHAPRPRYPYEARARHIMGSGLVRLDVNPQTGYVTSAKMLQTTGNKLLDDAALEAFHQWQFKPGSVKKVNVPITFTLQRAPASALAGKALALHAARPSYPAEARSNRWTGTGVVLVNVDPNSGRVTSARMQQSTGHKILDDAALDAFRQWQFRPGTKLQIRIPITFTMQGASYRWPYATHINP